MTDPSLHLVSRRIFTAVPGAPDESAGVVSIAGERIHSVRTVARAEELAALTADLEGQVLDFGERPLTPAFVNAHTHLALTFLRSVRPNVDPDNLVEDLFFHHESRLTEAAVRAFARMGAYESILSGVGFVWDHYYYPSAVIGALRDTGLGGVVAPTLQDLSGPGVGQAPALLEATAELAQGLENDAIFTAFGPHATDTVSSALLADVARAAEETGLPVHIHVAQSLDEYERVHAAHGCSPVELLERTAILDRRVLLVHGLFASDRDLDRLVPDRHCLGFCPYSQLIFGLPAPVGRWAEKGLPFFVATDCAASNDSMNVQKELRFLANQPTGGATFSASYRRFGAEGTPAAARAAWAERNQLRAGADRPSRRLLDRVFSLPGNLHPHARTGVLDAGAIANVLVFDPDHPSLWPCIDLPHTLAMADCTLGIHQMFVGGKARGEAGRFQESLTESETYRAHAEEARSWIRQLLLR
ncbi:MAG: amidohydrolase family protein [Myxococcota bacterium]